ncbi:septum formation initiator family protein [Patescibacteria group bacterium]|nr:septum formation initiator family protein [Patescibacteria group bacterium]
MKNKKYKSIKERIISVILILIVVFFIGFFVVINWKINKRRSVLSEQVLTLEQEVREMEEKNRDLKNKKEETESDEYIEKVAREQLDLKKPGEEVYVVQEEGSASAEASADEEKQTWWDKIKSIWMRD